VGQFQVLELFHGPTFAFKDVALQLLGHFFDLALLKRNARMTILGATSGDTGSAAIAAVKGRANIDCTMLFPLGRTSKIQELQMTSNTESNIHCLAVKDSVFDDCQAIVKACFNDPEFNAEMSLGAVNSINWCRILAQIVYYVYAVARSARPVSFVVPTANFGNMLAGYHPIHLYPTFPARAQICDVYCRYYARKLGPCIPIRSLVIASNSNAILPNFFATGCYSITPTLPTLSPSMDISISSNFERFLFDLWDRDAAQTAQKFSELTSHRSFSITPAQLLSSRAHFASFSIDETETLNTIRSVFASYQYLLCPHSAVGYCAAQKFASQADASDEDVVVVATAHIGKFVDGITCSLDGNNDGALRDALGSCMPAELSELALRSQGEGGLRRVEVDNSLEAVRGMSLPQW
jgi:threonine synthase